MVVQEAPSGSGAGPASELHELANLRQRVEELETRLRAGEQRRRAMLHIMSDLTESNRKLSDQRKAMLHILIDYEGDRKSLANQTERLNNSRRALMHILQDAHETNGRLELTRKAMIHIMGDLRRTTEEIGERERELREKQDQLVQAAKLATLGELTTGVAHELNNPLNNIGLYVGNVLDQMEMGSAVPERVTHNLIQVMEQVSRATEIITHLRTFGRAAPVSRERVEVNDIIKRSLALLREQLRLREVDIRLNLTSMTSEVLANPIQLEQVLMNLITNARDAISGSAVKLITISSEIEDRFVRLEVQDNGPGIPLELQQRIFDPFFTTKEVGKGTGLGLSIVYGIIQDHDGSIWVEPAPGSGARFIIRLPRAL